MCDITTTSRSTICEHTNGAMPTTEGIPRGSSIILPLIKANIEEDEVYVSLVVKLHPQDINK